LSPQINFANRLPRSKPPRPRDQRARAIMARGRPRRPPPRPRRSDCVDIPPGCDTMRITSSVPPRRKRLDCRRCPGRGRAPVDVGCRNSHLGPKQSSRGTSQKFVGLSPKSLERRFCRCHPRRLLRPHPHHRRHRWGTCASRWKVVERTLLASTNGRHQIRACAPVSAADLISRCRDSNPAAKAESLADSGMQRLESSRPQAGSRSPMSQNDLGARKLETP
jgi:hypothetical protein